MTSSDESDRTNVVIFGCLGVIVVAAAGGFAVIALGWLFGLGLRLSGI